MCLIYNTVNLNLLEMTRLVYTLLFLTFTHLLTHAALLTRNQIGKRTRNSAKDAEIGPSFIQRKISLEADVDTENMNPILKELVEDYLGESSQSDRVKGPKIRSKMRGSKVFFKRRG